MGVKNDLPLISVIIPAFNCEKTIARTLDSVIHQSFADLEVLVIDDGSSDRTASIIREYEQKDSRIRLLCNEKNLGVCASRNRGFSEARGEYAALLDGDDLWYPDMLRKEYEAAVQQKAHIVYCSYAVVRENGKNEETSRRDYVVPETITYERALIQSVMSCSTVLLDRSIVEKYRFDPSYYHEDLVLWLTLLRDGKKAVGVSEVLAEYRVREGSRAADKKKVAWNRYLVYREFCRCSMPVSLYLLVRYAWLGFWKYRK